MKEAYVAPVLTVIAIKNTDIRTSDELPLDPRTANLLKGIAWLKEENSEE